MCEFELKVKEEIRSLGVDLTPDLRIGAAVSGGADSVSLLISLLNILKESNTPLQVITVNHNIRKKEETLGDAIFVENLCKEFLKKGYSVICSIVEIEPGKVRETAKQRNGGEEEAARFLRYEAFNQFIKQNDLSYLCLAHNQNDQLENQLMRMLSGGSLDSLGGIKAKREKFIRPLINIQREQIEEYLHSKNICWRTDKTNLETQYFRNRVRLKLIPLLNDTFPGWQNAVLNQMKCFEEDGEVLQNKTEIFPLKVENNTVYINKSAFLAEKSAIQRRVLQKAFNLAGETSRITNDFLEDCVKSLLQSKNSCFSKEYEKYLFVVEKSKIFVKKKDKSHTDLVFFDIIEKVGLYDFPFGTLEIRQNENKNDSMVLVGIKGSDSFIKEQLPFIVRNFQIDDEVMTASGSYKKISDLYSDWHVVKDHKNLIPVIQSLGENQSITCVLGKMLGYKDWIVKK